MNNQLSKLQLKNICKMGQGKECCRYVVCDPENGFECAKHTSIKGVLDARCDSGFFLAQGDNCEGLK